MPLDFLSQLMGQLVEKKTREILTQGAAALGKHLQQTKGLELGTGQVGAARQRIRQALTVAAKLPGGQDLARRLAQLDEGLQALQKGTASVLPKQAPSRAARPPRAPRPPRPPSGAGAAKPIKVRMVPVKIRIVSEKEG